MRWNEHAPARGSPKVDRVTPTQPNRKGATRP
jgi:hypothetical protein